MKRSVQHFATLCGGRYQGEDRSWSGVNNDTRTLEAGQIYVALRGARFDGHAFLPAAAAAGAVAAVVDRPVERPPLPLIEVQDCQRALTRAATGWRALFKAPLVGVAGSNGKTTVKEMTAAILAQRGLCLATRGNLNNHIGVPLTLLRLTGNERSAVIEIGANHPGEVAALVEVARPTIGLITNAGAEHLEGFGDLDGVARAEGEMVAGLDAGGTAVINADDPYAGLWRGMTRARVATFGLDAAADFSATRLEETLSADGFSTSFTLRAPPGERAVTSAAGTTCAMRCARRRPRWPRARTWTTLPRGSP
jgi:UDP-N-acetylmuramoyl-tripeptide--D-alanyl-D-alanine ligase